MEEGSLEFQAPNRSPNNHPTLARLKELGQRWVGQRGFEGESFGPSSRFPLIFGFIIAFIIVILDILSAAGILVSGNKKAQTGIGSVNIILYTGIFITTLVFWILGYKALEINKTNNVVFMGILFITSLIFMSASIVQYRSNPEKHPADTGELVMGVFNLVLIIVFLIIAIYIRVNPMEAPNTPDITSIGYPFLTLFPLFKLITAIISITRANISRSSNEPIALQPSSKEPIALQPPTKEPPTKEPSSKEPIALQPPTKEPSTKEPPTKEPSPTIKPTSSYRGRAPPRPKSPSIPVEPVGIEQSVKKERERLLSPKK